MNTKFKVSRKAAIQPASKIGLSIGSSITVKNAINALIIFSLILSAFFLYRKGRMEKDFYQLIVTSICWQPPNHLFQGLFLRR